MSMVPLTHLIYLVMILLSHIAASLFFPKARFGKGATVAIWLLYAVLFLLLPPDNLTLNFFISFAAHFLLFFLTTTGRAQEKGFLFLSYACIYSYFNTLLNIMDFSVTSIPLKILFALCLISLMQVLLYAVLLPSFRKVAPFIRTGWGKFYAVVIGFFVLTVAQSMFPTLSPMTTKEMVIFLLSMLAFCITYTTVFASMKNMVALTQEKQKQTHTKLLLAQVESQTKEAELVRQNRHDMRHHYQMLFSYAQSGQLDKITDYLQRQTERVEAITTDRFCENETINNILRVYHQKAAAANIAMEIRAAAKPSLSASAPELVAIVANVLENALHGAQESGSSKPFIHVTIKHQAQRFVVSCNNTCAASLQFEQIPEDLRGIGIHSITATADQYNGSCLFCAKGGVFHCMVIMDE